MSTTDEHRRTTAPDTVPTSTTTITIPAQTPAQAPARTPASSAVTVPDDDGPASVRASDEEREATIARLHQALGEGRLDLDETDTRVSAAYAARYRHDLPALLTDLPYAPRAAPAAGAPTWGELWTSTVWRARVTLLGPDDAGHEPPTAAQSGTAALLTVLAALWFLACALLGAGLLG